MATGFQGRCVVSFESRRASDMARMIKRHGGTPISAPTMREVPLEQNPAAFTFADKLYGGQVDAVVFLTGVGATMLAQTIETRDGAARLPEALNSVITVARGPKPVAALRKLGVTPRIVVPEPNTWRTVLATMDEHGAVSGQRLAVQEYGESNTALIDGLRQRGAQVDAVPVYRWQLPQDLSPIRAAIDAIIAGRVDFALVTSATQVRHVFEVAKQDSRADALREAMARVCIGSIVPIATEAIVRHGMAADFEPDALHMSELVGELARRGQGLVCKKRSAVDMGVNTHAWRRIDMVWPGDERGAEHRTIKDSVFLQACRREPTPYTPVWIMRQAGRYQREYRAIRADRSMLEVCKSPDVCAELTLMAVDRLGVDAGIIFSDILLVVEPLGMKLDYLKGAGPVIDRPVRSRREIESLTAADADELGYVHEAIRLTRRALRPDVALIGFAGAPFTIASYMIEGGKSSQYVQTKTLMHGDEVAWHALMERLTDLLIAHLNHQIAAGADAVQLFDSWVGALSPDDYRRFVLPHVKRLIDSVDRAAPLIHFATGNPALLGPMKEAGGDVIGLDWRVDLADAWATLGDDVAVMGNIDPVVLFDSAAVIRRQVQAVLDKAAGRPGHIFNLGHGVLPNTPPTHVAELVDAVHELSARPHQALSSEANDGRF